MRSLELRPISSPIKPAKNNCTPIIAAPMAMKNNGKWWHWAIMLASLAMTAFLGISPIYIMLCVIVIAAAVTMYNDKRYRRKMHIKELKGKKKEEFGRKNKKRY